jgi:MinD-like ATPase involved in chromosome partitioning or flagellar assembly
VTLVAVVGDCTTTTCVALAATWPTGNPDPTDVLILEADPSGGSLAGWLDTPNSPTLGTLVANTASEAGRTTAAMSTIESMVLTSDSGVRLIAAPTRSIPARRAIEEAGVSIIPALGSARSLVVLADLGRNRLDESRPILNHSAVVVVIHRQVRTSPAAEAVRLERLIETIEHVGAPIVLGLIGRDPFDPSEIAEFISTSVPGAVADSFVLADDALAAAVLAGRTGVSARRLARLPLMRSARTAGTRLRESAGAGSHAGSVGSR